MKTCVAILTILLVLVCPGVANAEEPETPLWTLEEQVLQSTMKEETQPTSTFPFESYPIEGLVLREFEEGDEFLLDLTCNEIWDCSGHTICPWLQQEATHLMNEIHPATYRIWETTTDVCDVQYILEFPDGSSHLVIHGVNLLDHITAEAFLLANPLTMEVNLIWVSDPFILCRGPRNMVLRQMADWFLTSMKELEELP